MKIKEVAKIMNVTEQYVRVGLQQEKLPFGTAIKMPGSSSYTYHINERQFKKYMDGEVENNEIELIIESLGNIGTELNEIKDLLTKLTRK